MDKKSLGICLRKLKIYFYNLKDKTRFKNNNYKQL